MSRSSVLDIRERKRAEEETAQARMRADRFAQALDNITSYVYIKDCNGRYVYANRATLDLFRCTATELAGKDDASFFPPDAAMQFKAIDRRVLEKGENTAEEVIGAVMPDGRRSMYWEVKTPIFSDPGKLKVDGICGISTDITERKRAEEQLHRLNRELRAITTCNQVLIHASNEQDLLSEVCRSICEQAGYKMGWVGYAEHDEQKSVRPIAWAGYNAGYVEHLDISWGDNERGRGPTGTAIRTGEIVCTNNIAQDPRLGPWRNEATKRGYRASVALPLRGPTGAVFGALMLYSGEVNAFSDAEIRLLSELVGDLAFGISALRIRLDRDRVAAERQEYFKFFQASSDLMAIAEPFGHFVKINPSFMQILGYSEQELLGKPFIDFVHPADRESTSAEMTRQMQIGSSLNFENRYICKNGSYRWLSWRAVYVAEEGFTYATARDVTDLKMVTETLAHSSAYNRRLIEASLDPLVTIDAHGKITDANAATERITGFARSELIGTDFSDYFTEPDKAQAGYQQVFRESLVHDYALELKHRSGKITPVLYNASIYRDEAGTVVGVFAAARDITERVALEQELRAAIALRDEFMSIASHELKTPLSALHMQLQLLNRLIVVRTDWNRERISSIGTGAFKSAQQLANLLDQLLDVTRIRVGKLSLRPEEIDLGARIADHITRTQEQAGQKGSRITVKAESPVLGRWDPDRIDQIISNLLSNAIKYGEGKPIEVSVSLDEENQTARITMRDQGMGIPKEMQSKIFERFQRAIAGDKITGLGLGLYIVKQIIEAHGGSITVESDVGKGSLFTVILPLTPGAKGEKVA